MLVIFFLSSVVGFNKLCFSLLRLGQSSLVDYILILEIGFVKFFSFFEDGTAGDGTTH